jgi:hypothetical protein
LSLTGPGSVSGYVGGSLRVQCQYSPSYKGYMKYWCRGPHDTTCKTIVETDGSEKEKRSGPVSIRDHASNSTITVIMEDLSEDNAGSYWCKIQTSFIWDSWSRDPSVSVRVNVFPGKTKEYLPAFGTCVDICLEMWLWVLWSSQPSWGKKCVIGMKKDGWPFSHGLWGEARYRSQWSHK